MKTKDLKIKKNFDGEDINYKFCMLTRLIHYSNIIEDKPDFLIDNGITSFTLLETEKGTKVIRPLRYETTV